MTFETTLYSAGVPLKATAAAPGDGYKPGVKYPTVVLCHGNSRDRNDGLDRMAEVLADNGIASLRFDFRGNGADAYRRNNFHCDTELTDDVRAALSFAEALPFADPERIGLSGVSLGAAVTALYCASSDERVKSAVVMACPDNMEQMHFQRYADAGASVDELKTLFREDAKIEAMTGVSQVMNRQFLRKGGKDEEETGLMEYLENPAFSPFLTVASYASLLRLKPVEHIDDVRCPLFFVHGREDTGVPWQGAKRMFEKLSSRRSDAKLTIYEGVDHNIPIHPKREQVFKDIADWFNATL